MRLAVFAALLVATASPVMAKETAVPAAAMSTPVAARQGDMLRDANNARLGAVDVVNRDGSVSVIIGGRYVKVPATSLGMTNGKLTTSLTRAQLEGR